MNIPSAQPAATLSGERGSRTIFRLSIFQYLASDEFISLSDSMNEKP